MMHSSENSDISDNTKQDVLHALNDASESIKEMIHYLSHRDGIDEDLIKKAGAGRLFLRDAFIGYVELISRKAILTSEIEGGSNFPDHLRRIISRYA